MFLIIVSIARSVDDTSASPLRGISEQVATPLPFSTGAGVPVRMASPVAVAVTLVEAGAGEEMAPELACGLFKHDRGIFGTESGTSGKFLFGAMAVKVVHTKTFC